MKVFEILNECLGPSDEDHGVLPDPRPLTLSIISRMRLDGFYNTTHHHSCRERPDIVFMSVKMETVWSATLQ